MIPRKGFLHANCLCLFSLRSASAPDRSPLPLFSILYQRPSKKRYGTNTPKKDIFETLAHLIGFFRS
ncbi:hypothetical protein Cabther_A0032 [Chloracidobacterium thermophilum B]|jgi:hypothetical protein|uniref:Uncharacterized protein n=1 Tax=Chloracidobacterium thermophilum (strain B) TaxID=981222 RepID=G2LDY1_CHLTF|nr:hypothetical protein Cabther_A0032 [Chloracidobacterium thermophilum B]